MKTIARCAALAAAALSASSAQALPFAFTKLPAGQTSLSTSASPQTVDALAFEMRSIDPSATTVTKMSFQITGTLPLGTLTDLQLISYPLGLGSPGVLVGTSDGSTWGHSASRAMITIPLAVPVTLQQNTSNTFVLRATVKGATSFFFNPDVHVVTVSSNGVERALVAETEDLPLPGETFRVN
ncbi:MAG TPA: hypothetical protein VI356_20315 [Myxococcales bacterium]